MDNLETQRAGIEKVKAAYGSWASPITTDLMTQGSVGFSQVAFDQGSLYWTESRASEKGRTTLVTKMSDNDDAKTMLPAPYNVRSWVHEYGGGAFLIVDGKVFFSDPGAEAVMTGDVRGGEMTQLIASHNTGYADFTCDHQRDRIICIAEEHPVNDKEPLARLVAISMLGDVTVLAEGADFYSSPRVSPDGLNLCWIEWSHPQMPWDETRLMRARLSVDGGLERVEQIAGGDSVSVIQPEYAADGKLYYISDQSGYWNVHQFHYDGEDVHYPIEGDCGYPHWVFGMRSYAPLVDGKLAVAFSDQGDWKMTLLNPADKSYEILDLPWVSFDSLQSDGNRVAFVGGRQTGPDQIVLLDMETRESHVYATSSNLNVAVETISCPETIVFPTLDGPNGEKRMAYANFYPPANADYEGLEGELPPVIVRSHGGPTGQALATFSLKYQFWTSRGFAVLDVNYSGSTGFGRAYRDRLAGNWGVLDVADCEKAAQYMVDQGRVDGERLIIAGGSAGGYTTLAALTFTDSFKAGCSSYGIGDLAMLAQDTHKFESRYMDKLVGIWPDEADIYRDRSPLNHTEELNCPVLFLQGADDKVVPPNQADKMAGALRDKGVPVAYVLFDGEGHGFRQAENIKTALETELSFYGQIFDIPLRDDAFKCEIDNLS